ncbi:hypothetical protein DSO57_1002918 [Entomophthora muscae]|uniref:Uncharacterized protein n=1 Tax=Entomophthora muscae TaxID=34485 RepID=A0ACC2SLA6_9FUNG|nr:hypothetical protein DSO57_1002918 [Entomophthora muscae]
MQGKKIDNRLLKITDYNKSLSEESSESYKLLSDSNLKLLPYNINNATGVKVDRVKEYLTKEKAGVIGLQEISKHYKPWSMHSEWQVTDSAYCAIILTNPKLQFVTTETLFTGCMIKALINYDG